MQRSIQLLVSGFVFFFNLIFVPCNIIIQLLQNILSYLGDFLTEILKGVGSQETAKILMKLYLYICQMKDINKHKDTNWAFQLKAKECATLNTHHITKNARTGWGFRDCTMKSGMCLAKSMLYLILPAMSWDGYFHSNIATKGLRLGILNPLTKITRALWKSQDVDLDLLPSNLALVHFSTNDSFQTACFGKKETRTEKKWHLYKFLEHSYKWHAYKFSYFFMCLPAHSFIP